MKKELENFLTYLDMVENKSKNTISAYKRDLTDFVCWSETNLEAVAYSDLKKQDLLSFIMYRAKLGDSPATRARKTSSLKSFFAYLADNEVIDRDNAQGLKSPKLPKKEPVSATADEARTILSCCKTARDKAMLSVMLNCGLRRSEVVELNVESINHDDMSLLVHGKGDKERVVYMNEDTYKLVTEYLKQRTEHYTGASEALFLTRTGNRLLPNKINEIMSKLVANSGIDKHYTPHTCRKTCATLMARAGEPIQTVQKVLGHSNIQTTMIYTAVADEDKSNAGRNFKL